MISAFPTKSPILFCLERRGEEDKHRKGEGQRSNDMDREREREILIITLRFTGLKPY